MTEILICERHRHGYTASRECFMCAYEKEVEKRKAENELSRPKICLECGRFHMRRKNEPGVNWNKRKFCSVPCVLKYRRESKKEVIHT